MKTVFKRALSVILSVFLVFSGVVPTFAAERSTFNYNTYAVNAENENVHYFLDEIDEILAQNNFCARYVLTERTSLMPEVAITLDFRSIDAFFGTLDDFRLIFNTVKYFCGDLKDLNLNVVEKNLTRADDGDVKVVREFLELIAVNDEIVEKLFDGTLDIGIFESVLNIDMSELFGEGGISALYKEMFVDTLYEGKEDTAEYWAAYDRAMNNFDLFVYNDLVSYLVSGTFVEGIEVTERTTVNELVSDMLMLLIENGLISLLDGFEFDFSQEGEEYAVLNDIIEFDGDYDFTEIGFSEDESVLSQLNNVLGLIVLQIMPLYSGWVEGDYTLIGENITGLLRHIAEESQLIEDSDTLSDDVLVLEFLKLIFFFADSDGEKEIYNEIESAETLYEAINKISLYFGSGKGYTYNEEATYENVLGDLLIGLAEGKTPLYDEKGNAVVAGSGASVWDVANYILNFYLVEKNLDELMGFELDAGSDFFEKADLFIGLLASDGTADFSSAEYVSALTEALFAADFQALTDLTVVEILENIGDEYVGSLVYNTAYNIINNWSGDDKNIGFIKYTVAPFHNTMSNEGIANIFNVVVQTLSKRAPSFSMALGLYYGAITGVQEDIVPGIPATCTKDGVTCRKYCAVCDRDFLSGETVIPMKGHSYKTEITEEPSCKTGTERLTCVVCDYTEEREIPAIGHNLDDGRVTAEPTCTSTGLKIYNCDACEEVFEEVLAAKGHSYDEGTTVTAPTCTSTGLKIYTCADCGETVEEILAANGHSADEGTVTKAPTCTGSGIKTYHCTVCGVTLSVEMLAPTGHTPDSGIIEVEATCTVSGSIIYNCTVCGEKISLETIEATGHIPNDGVTVREPTCTEEGAKIYTCTVCSEVIRVETIEATDHTSDGGVVSTEPTCTQEGLIVYTCEVCNQETGTQIISPTGHSLVNGEARTPTCTQVGWNAYTRCENCDYTTFEEIPATGHNALVIAAVPASCTVKGFTDGSYCSLCSTVIKTPSEVPPTGHKDKNGDNLCDNCFAAVGEIKPSVTPVTKPQETTKPAETTKPVETTKPAGTTKPSSDNTENEKAEKPAKVKVKSAKSLKKKKAVVIWNAVKNANGYQVAYSLNKKFTKKTTKIKLIKKVKTTKITLKKLKSGKKYYIKLRAYKTVNGKKVYGSYSKVKTVKIK